MKTTSFVAGEEVLTLTRYVDISPGIVGNKSDEPYKDVRNIHSSIFNFRISQGNEQFRELVEKRKRVYLTARFKREKRLIASSIVSEIRGMTPPGRFLARKGNKDDGFWYDIGDEKARDKASQALRENAPSIRAEIETEIHEQRGEMYRSEAEDNVQKVPQYYVAPPGPTYAPPPPPHHPSYQAYWDWYHHHYGYPSSMQAPLPYPPPHAAPAPALSIHTSNPTTSQSPHPPYWGHPVIPPARDGNGEGLQADGNVNLVMSQEEDDHRLAMQLQHEEKAALYESRKERYKHSLARRSNAHLGTAARAATPVSHVRRQPPPPSVSASYEQMETVDAPEQEAQDYRLALALHEREQEEIIRSRSTKTSRSMAFPQFSRTAGIISDLSLSESFMAWINGDSKPKEETRRTVQFEDEDMSVSHLSHSVRTLQRQSSTASTDRPLQPGSQQNHGLLYQAAKGIMGWDATQEDRSTTGIPYNLYDDMETEGYEVQLRDPNDETMIPPPDRRAQTEWSSRSTNSWIPDQLTPTWVRGDRDHSLSGQMGISPSHSLGDMDTSTNAASVGGASLCRLFEQDESINRALHSIPSWERNIRSKSSVQSDKSMIRVGELKLFRAPPGPSLKESSGSGDMDWNI
jgi:hypothetical protein